MKSLDQPAQRCKYGMPELNTSACIAQFIEEQMGCSVNILGSQYSTRPKCSTKEDMLSMANISKFIEEANGNDIYDMTGCLSPCEKDEYKLSADDVKKIPVYSSEEACELHLQFRMVDSSYKEEEQYILYEVDSFFADVGGYMGLLLGSSLLSLYMAMESFMKKLLCHPLKGNIQTA